MSIFDGSRSRKTYSAGRVQPVAGFVGITTVSGGFGIDVTSTKNSVIVDLDKSVFSGIGGISVIVQDDKIILSGSSTSTQSSGSLITNTVYSRQIHDVTSSTITYAVMGSMSSTISVSSGSSILVEFNTSYLVSAAFIPTLFRATIDGTPIAYSARAHTSFAANKHSTFNMTCVSDPLDSGRYDIAIEWAAQTGSVAMCLASSRSDLESAWLILREVQIL
jgi:hypothetical protein